jgi:regulator of sigma E protease
MLLSILIMLLLISVLIIAHEFGHFFVARWCGVRVERFGMGLPIGPAIWSKKVGQTEVCLHPILFGGYVSFPDDSEESTVPLDSRERFENQPPLNRLAIALAGITVNFLLGWLLFAGLFMTSGINTVGAAGIAGLVPAMESAELPAASLPQPVASRLEANRPLVVLNDRVALTGTEGLWDLAQASSRYYRNQPGTSLAVYLRPSAPDAPVRKVSLIPSVAAESGLMPGDKIIGVDGVALSSAGFLDAPTSHLIETIQKHPGQSVVLTVQPLVGAVRNVNLMPMSRVSDGRGSIGAELIPADVKPATTTNPFIALGNALEISRYIVVKNFEGLGRLVTGQANAKDLAGPIRLVDTGARLIESSGIAQGLLLTAMISVILAVMNVLPVPPLDGSHLLFIGIELLKGSPLQKAIQERIVQVGFVGLLLLMSFVLFNDLLNLFNRNGLAG